MSFSMNFKTTVKTYLQTQHQVTPLLTLPTIKGKRRNRFYLQKLFLVGLKKFVKNYGIVTDHALSGP